jgi:hypothetical protein
MLVLIIAGASPFASSTDILLALSRCGNGRPYPLGLSSVGRSTEVPPVASEVRSDVANDPYRLPLRKLWPTLIEAGGQRQLSGQARLLPHATENPQAAGPLPSAFKPTGKRSMSRIIAVVSVAAMVLSGCASTKPPAQAKAAKLERAMAVGAFR